MNAPSVTPVPGATASSIHTRAVLVHLHIGVWQAAKYCKEAAHVVEANYNATRGSASTRKQLLPGDASAYREAMTLAGEIRQWHRAHTLAWGDADGWRLLTTRQFTEYTTWMRAKLQAFEAACDRFADAYPRLVDQAKRLLNGWFHDSDYPEPGGIRERFAVDIKYAPLPATGDIRLDLGADQIAAIEQQVTDRVQASIAGAMHDAWSRLHDVVATIAERCDDTATATPADLKRGQKIFRDTLITNVQETCTTLRKLNLTDDPELEKLRARVERELGRVDPADLRESADLRKETAEKAQSIIDAMAGFYTPAEGAGDEQ